MSEGTRVPVLVTEGRINVPEAQNIVQARERAIQRVPHTPDLDVFDFFNTEPGHVEYEKLPGVKLVAV